MEARTLPTADCRITNCTDGRQWRLYWYEGGDYKRFRSLPCLDEQDGRRQATDRGMRTAFVREDGRDERVVEL